MRSSAIRRATATLSRGPLQLLSGRGRPGGQTRCLRRRKRPRRCWARRWLSSP